MKRRLSSLEILLIVVSSLLLICCIGLAVVSSLSLKPKGKLAVCFEPADHSRSFITMMFLFVCKGASKPVQLMGRMAIVEGAVFSEELKNSSSPQFKSLAYDVQQLVRPQAFILKKQLSVAFFLKNQMPVACIVERQQVHGAAIVFYLEK